MKLNNLPKQKRRRVKKRLGKGPGSRTGKTAGRGHKGGYARSGYTISPAFEGGQIPLGRRTPGRGFNNYEFQEDFREINVGQLERLSTTKVDRVTLIEAGLMRASDKKVKILGNGTVSKALTVNVNAFSKGAEKKIKAAGGTITLISVAPAA